MLLWHSAQRVISALANCFPWMSSWQSSHWVGAALKSTFDQLGFKVGRLVAIDASRRAVRPEQWQTSSWNGRIRRVPSTTSWCGTLRIPRRTIRPRLLHALFELSFVRIGVATRAIQILPVVNHGRLGLELRRFLVAIGAGHGNVPAGKHEARLLVLGQAEGGGPVSLEIVAAITGIEVWRRRKLPGMLVGVTIGAALELNLEQRVLPFRDMALRAFQPRMPPCSGYALAACSFTVNVEGFHPFTVWQEAHSPPSGRLANWPLCGSGLWQSMHFWNTSGFLKSPLAWHCAQSTLACLPSSGNFVLEWSKRSLTACSEIFFHPLVLWHDWQPCGKLPWCGSLWQSEHWLNGMPDVLRLAVRSVGVALGALHLGMQAGQRIARLRVIELGLTGLADIDRFPVHEIVALLAVWAQAAFVLILVAGDATGRQTEVGPAQILDFDGRTFLRQRCATDCGICCTSSPRACLRAGIPSPCD